MAAKGEQRIEVWQRNRLVPLLPGAAAVAVAPLWRNAKLERHRVGAIEIPEHQHGELCLHLQVGGAPELEWWSEGRNHVEQTSAGEMILLAPGTRDRLRWSESSERLVVSVKTEMLEREAAALGVRGAVDFRNQWALRDAGLARLVLEMQREAGDGFPLGALYVDMLETELTHALLRGHAEADGVWAPLRGKLPQPKLRRALEFMTANLHRDLRLEEIAAELGLSSSHFAHEFRASTGQTPYQYVMQQRVEQAKAMLRGGLAVKEVAVATGFSSDVNFVRAFRQKVGVSPAAWVKAQ